MDAIDILMNEHSHIKKVLSAIIHDCEGLAEGKEVNVEFYREVIDFVRNYADKYHHKKEEKKLFNKISEIDENLKNGPIMGMLLEHDLGRSYIKDLEQALNEYEKGDKRKKVYVIAHAISYAVMLQKHIDKEDTALYMMARRRLDKEVQESMTEEFEAIEGEDENIAIRKKYMEFADNLKL